MTLVKINKNAVRNLAVCSGAIWRGREKSQYRCTTTIYRMYKIPNNVWENLLPVWLLVRTTCSFRSVWDYLYVIWQLLSPLRGEIRKKKFNRCTSTFSAQNYCSGIFFKSLSYLYEVVRKPCPPIFGLFEILDRNFVKLVAPPSSKKRTIASEKNLKTALKSAYKRQRNACTNYAPLERTALRPRSVTKKNIQTQYFRIYSWRSLFDLPKLCTVIELIKVIKKVPNIFRSNA